MCAYYHHRSSVFCVCGFAASSLTCEHILTNTDNAHTHTHTHSYQIICGLRHECVLLANRIQTPRPFSVCHPFVNLSSNGAQSQIKWARLVQLEIMDMSSCSLRRTRHDDVERCGHPLVTVDSHERPLCCSVYYVVFYSARNSLLTCSCSFCS